LDAVRTLWDPEHVDRSWIRERIQLIPRLIKIAKQARPDLRVAIGEYNFYAEKSQSGGIALAEVLGVFGVEGLDYAYYWNIPPKNSPAADAFKLYRNYDGKGGSFGDYRLPVKIAKSNSDSGIAAFSSTNQARNQLTTVLINRSYDKSARTVLRVSAKEKLVVKSAVLYLRDEHGFRNSTISCADSCEVILPALTFGMIVMNI